jgi:protease I
MQKKVIIILIVIGAFLLSVVLGFLGYKYFKEKPMRDLLRKQAKESAPPKTGMKKKVAIIIAFKDFRDEEYFKTQEVLFKGETDIKIVSTQKGTAVGADGGEVNVDLVLDEVKVDDFDAIVFIGGPGAPQYLDNEASYKIAKEAVSKNKILAAICISPTILAKAGVLEGKMATVWHSALDKSPIKILEKNGAKFVDEKVVQDGNIITGNGPSASEAFGQKILENLKSL